MPKVFDCFTFFNELEILDLRLAEMSEVVDYFVLVESSLTFTGLPKPLYFLENQNRYAAFKDKIIHIVVDDFPETHSFWAREHYQREAIRRGLEKCQSDDLVIISDVDEILRPRCVKAACELDGFIQFHMDMYQFFLNLRAYKDSWTACFAFKYEYINRVPDFSRIRPKQHKAEIEAIFPGKFYRLHDAGWHFTHLGGLDMLRQKFKSYSHANDLWPRCMMREGALVKHLAMGGVVGNCWQLSEFLPIDDTFPVHVQFREAYYRELGYIKNIYEAIREMQQELLAVKKAYAIQVYGGTRQHPALGNLTASEFVKLANIRDLFEGKVFEPPVANGELVSLGKRATQSSVSPYSRGVTVESDASNALDGDISQHYKFHTDVEDSPWWMVDLDLPHEITEIRVYNRMDTGNDEVRNRASLIKIEVGESLDAFVEVYRSSGALAFGGIDGFPLIWTAFSSIKARYVRIVSLKRTFLHLNQVQIFGRVIAS